MSWRAVVKAVETFPASKIFIRLQPNCFDTIMTWVSGHVNKGHCCFSCKCLFACANWLSEHINREYSFGPFMQDISKWYVLVTCNTPTTIFIITKFSQVSSNWNQLKKFSPVSSPCCTRRRRKPFVLRQSVRLILGHAPLR